MGRNSGGGYTNPIPPFVPGTTIKTTEMNPKFQDIYDALSDSLSRSGQGFMQVPLRLTDGSAAAPSLTFTSDIGTGLYRSAPYTVRMVSQAATLQEWGLTYVNINRPLTVSPPAGTAATGIIATGVLTGQGGSFIGGTPTGATAGADGVTTVGGDGGPGAAGGVGLTATGGLGTSTGLGIRATGGIVGLSAPLDAPGTVRPTRYYSTVANTPATSGATYPLNGLTWTNTAGFNNVGLDVYSRNEATVTGWQVVRLGLRYDVDNVVGAGGMFELGSTGASLARGEAATATAPVAGLTMRNAHIAWAPTVIQPSSSTSVVRTLTPESSLVAWAQILTTGPGAGGGAGTRVHTIVRGLNIASVTQNNLNVYYVTFSAPSPFASTAYGFSGSYSDDGDVRRNGAGTATTSVFQFIIRRFNGGLGNYETVVETASGGTIIDIKFWGHQ